MLQVTDRPQRRKSVAFRVIMGKEIVFLNLDNAYYYSANEVGSRIWELCDGTRTIDEIVRELSLEYNVLAEDCAADVTFFIEELSKEGLIAYV
jgi:pyrroloquinoline quinone biosynthesis protein D